MAAVYRLARTEDLLRISEIHVEALSDLRKRHGFSYESTVTPSTTPDPSIAFLLEEDPEAFWVAESDGKVIGFSDSWMQDSFWFLSGLFVSPVFQGQGIGKNLLERTLGRWRDAKIENRATITPAYNPTSISVYMRCGMYPREPLYGMSATSETVRHSQVNMDSLDYEKLQDFESSLELLRQIDTLVLGFSSDWRHECFFRVQQATCYLFSMNKNPAGYAYVHKNGDVGPLAVMSTSSFGSVMNSALMLAASQGADKVSLFLAGSNDQAVSLALRYKMRIDGLSVLMSSKQFGNWRHYSFGSPGLM